MVYLIIFIALTLFAIWVLQPFLKSKDSDKNKSTLENNRISDERNINRPRAIFKILAFAILFALVVWLLPKIGINFLSLFQKIVSLTSVMRNVLPF
tara:strand:- start:261 stop:548 length:288 start_codon:yes stop_codon:yes gene_type:complete